jgi:hypothetical protein
LKIKHIVTSADRIKTAHAISLEASLEESLETILKMKMMMILVLDP